MHWFMLTIFILFWFFIFFFVNQRKLKKYFWRSYWSINLHKSKHLDIRQNNVFLIIWFILLFKLIIYLIKMNKLMIILSNELIEINSTRHWWITKYFIKIQTQFTKLWFGNGIEQIPDVCSFYILFLFNI